MQGVHSMGGGGGGRFFGGSGGGDRRLRPHHHPSQQALKCPRCDSLNTKFCYYNNYNLCQPRHFCKSCRRYWTRGGVLRKVPVGGGCRKTKRSKSKSSSSSSPAVSPPPPPQPNSISDQHKASSHSSSESSSLTNSTAAAAAMDAVSAPSSTGSASNNLMINIHHQDSKFLVSQSGVNAGLEPGGAPTAALLEQSTEMNGMLSEIGSFTSLIRSSNDVPFGSGDISASPFGLDQQAQGYHHHNQLQQNQWALQNQELKMQEMSGGLLDQTALVDLSGFHSKSNGGGGGGFGSLDWQPGSEDQGLFDLPNTVDQAYWSQSQWTDQDHPTLYLP